MNKKPTLTTNNEQLIKNQAIIKSFYAILKAAKELLSSIEDEPLRYTLTRIDKHKRTRQVILHEVVSPLIYLRIELHETNDYSIHYGYETLPAFAPYFNITSAFIRLVYKLSMKDSTDINIEDAVRADWVIDNCSEAYEYIEERNKHHRFQLIKHKPKQVKRKLMRVA
ncbi:hypothetical protein [Mucilaginibacter sp. KACC 22063]|uniref:hypothetical protein n=1 Tax=Mucilaginibacter sp. KACC 22063 TaxID=3025666 RepID=UPI0023660FCB|nr:hypothetical protein [Mucilaginibacter sp. KACC 22063]WDF54893.1 hypothetical protein PQ461_18345 [Mucilaginibacter sp. KACC 22063]